MPSILKLPPEMFPLISSHLPLQHSPTTLLSLAQTCSNIYSLMVPLLYRKIIVTGEDHVTQVLERVLTDNTFGPLIRELHVRIDLATEIDKKQTGTTALEKLQAAIENGSLPHINHLGIVLLKFGWPYHWQGEGRKPMNDRYFLPSRFWPNLRKYCPSLQGICIDGVDDSPEDPWADKPEFYDLKHLQGMRTVALKFNGLYYLENKAIIPLELITLSSSLRSLNLSFVGYIWEDPQPFFSFTFPHLKSLSLCGWNFQSSQTTDAMAFWSRHPGLERVDIYTTSSTGWFSDPVEAGLLPNLSHLRTMYQDVKALQSHLAQVEYLSITHSYNHQIPYLLRSHFPDHLPNLKSLEVHQVPSSHRYDCDMEGGMWYEDSEKAGIFRVAESPGKAKKSMDRCFIHSLVQAAPNLEELCLHGLALPTNDIQEHISPFLGHLRRLERFYFRAFDYRKQIMDEVDLDDFKARCRLLGNSCLSLQTVTDISFYKNGPYLNGTIKRDNGGMVYEVVLGRGFGMEFTGGSDDPFPLNESI